jgi:hypothetical protein
MQLLLQESTHGSVLFVKWKTYRNVSSTERKAYVEIKDFDRSLFCCMDGVAGGRETFKFGKSFPHFNFDSGWMKAIVQLCIY